MKSLLKNQRGMAPIIVVLIIFGVIVVGGVGAGTVEIIAFDRSFTFGTSAINMQASTLDGTPLAELLGSQVDISEDHTLILECR